MTLPNPRYEWKLIAKGCTLADALLLVRRHPAGFREAYPARVVNNIYLDTPELADYSDHVNGSANRAKTRVRWYGKANGVCERPTLERKLKRGAVSGKLAYELPPIPLHPQSYSSSLQTAFRRSAIPEWLMPSLLHLQPSLENRYLRHYFVSANRQFRLTVDSELEFTPARAHTANGHCQAIRMPLLIIELKFNLPQAEHAHSLTNRFPFRLARCSKYVLGLETTAGL